LKKFVFFKFLIFLFYFSFSYSHAVVRDLVETIKVLRINSLSQKLIDYNKVELEGDVEVLIDFASHIWADKVVIDKEEQTVMATSEPESFVVLEVSEFIMLADIIFLDIEKKTGWAKNVKFHFDGKFVSAQNAEKLDDLTWRFTDLVYTSCDRIKPHWMFKAKEAKLTKYMIRGKGLVLKVGNIPVAAVPGVVLPAQSQSKSGFLIPKLSLDKRLGLGIVQEYYWDIGPRLDTTVGINWRQKKGYVLYDQFRHGRGVDNYTLINSKVAKEKNAFLERNMKIVQGKDWRFSVDGQHFQPFSLADLKIDNLINIDIGTDQRIGYDFQSKTDAVEDSFLNSWIARLPTKQGLVSLGYGRFKIYREQFTFNDGKKSQDERFVKDILNHIEWDGLYNSFFKVFKYKHNFFTDRAISDHNQIEKTYDGNTITSETTIAPREKTNTTRLYYQGNLEASVNVKNNILSCYFAPNIQVRDCLKNYNQPLIKHNAFECRFGLEGAARIILQGGLEWALPEYVAFSKDYNHSYYMQPILQWKYTPKVQQDNWYYVDQYDRLYPKNRFNVGIRNSWYFTRGRVEFNISQAYECYSKNDIFPLDRPLRENHLLPLNFDFSFDYDSFHIGIFQGFDFRNPTLVESEIETSFQLKRLEASLSWLYQHPDLQKTQEMLSDTPSFLLVGLGLRLSKALRITYNGQFFSKYASIIAPFKGIDALFHKLYFDLKGHCWGLSIGFEEKRYREQGDVKSERGIFLSFKLNSLGSFSSKLKRVPVILNDEGLES
jgi:lipopolysaccharide assembly outer membrane protein LptD (OstA)